MQAPNRTLLVWFRLCLVCGGTWQLPHQLLPAEQQWLITEQLCGNPGAIHLIKHCPYALLEQPAILARSV